MGLLDSLFKPNVEKLKAKKDSPGLLAALTHKDTTVRKDAVAAMGDIGDSYFIDPLINALKDPHISVQKEAVLSLGKMKNEKAANVLIGLLIDKDFRDVTSSALVNLGHFAIGSLIGVLKYEDKILQLTAIEALVKIGSPSIKPVVLLLSSDDKGIIQAAVDILQKIGYQPSSEADQITYYLAAKKWDDLVKIGKPALDILITALKDDNFEIRQAVLRPR